MQQRELRWAESEFNSTPSTHTLDRRWVSRGQSGLWGQSGTLGPVGDFGAVINRPASLLSPFRPDRSQSRRCVWFVCQSRMSAVKRATLLLLLLAAIGANAAPDHDDCHGLNTPLNRNDLHKILGDWVLVWSVSKDELTPLESANLTSSHVELRQLDDDDIVFTERNMFHNNSCVNYYINMTLDESHNHTLHTTGGMVEKAGVFSPDPELGHVDVYESCADCLVMVYLSTEGKYLLSYRREGHHRDAEALKAALDDHRKQSECLGFPHDEAFSYDGAADFCHRKSSPEEEVEATAKEQAAPTAKVEES